MTEVSAATRPLIAVFCAEKLASDSEVTTPSRIVWEAWRAFAVEHGVPTASMRDAVAAIAAHMGIPTPTDGRVHGVRLLGGDQ